MKQESILSFWFGDDSLHTTSRQNVWFSPTHAYDDIVRERFSALVEEASNGGFDDWGKTPRGALALVILLDQFRRHVYRGSAEAFSHDPHARKIAETAIDHGFDQKLTVIERMFLYLPLEHTEDLVAQERAVGLFRELREVAGPEETKMLEVALDFAIRHRDCIAKFGRFPHRNETLGRENTKEEREFLKRPDSRF
ncbi:MAG: DUF924 family protein [Bdellovibrionota bacterium]